jgi:glycosyltransferase involved in cell wall biosynthesis
MSSEPKPYLANQQTPPLVSVVITTRDEERHLETCLRSVAVQTYPNVELIVIDNGSTDHTKAIARRYTPIVLDMGPERSAQRNYGMIHVATGEFVMYVDADMILSQHLIESCVHSMRAMSDVALHIREIVLGTTFWARVRRFERGFYDGTVIDGARFFRRDVFVRIGGFDETLSGPEDWDVDKKIKQIGTIGLLDDTAHGLTSERAWSLYEFVVSRGIDPVNHRSVVYHDESEFTLRAYVRKKSYYAVSFAPYVSRWGKTDPDIQKQLGPMYRYVLVFLEQNKWRALIAHPALTCGMFVLRLLVGVVYLGSIARQLPNRTRKRRSKGDETAEGTAP